MNVRAPVNRGMVLLVLSLVVLPLLAIGHSGDYQAVAPSWVGDNASPAIHALVGGHFDRFASLHPWMGSFSLLLRWPFAALGEAVDASELAVYKLGALPCLLAVGALALYLNELLRARGRSKATRMVVAAVCLINPVTFKALEVGHPEDLLAGALCVGAVLAAGRGRPTAAGVMLGVAVATKQWAILAVAPALLAAPAGRKRLALSALMVVALATLPLLAINPERLVTITREASKTRVDGPASVWTPFAVDQHRTIFDGTQRRTITGHVLPSGLTRIPKLLIVLVPIPLALLLWRRRKVGLEDALGLLALVLLLRCLLDPVSNGYYYAPFLLALAAYESVRRRGPPLLTIAVAAAAWATFEFPAERSAITAAWACWALPVTAILAAALYAPARLGARRRAELAGA